MTKKLSLKERLAQKRASGNSLSTTGKIKKPVSKEEFAKKQEEIRLKKEEERRLAEIKRKEEAKRQKEIERIAALEAARKEAAAKAEYKAKKRELELAEKKEMLKAISGETNAGDPDRPKIEYIILVGLALFSFVVAWTLGRTFIDRKVKNDSVTMAKKALSIFEETDKVLDNYAQYLRNHKGDTIDFGAGKILAKQGEKYLKNDEFALFPTYGASFYEFGNTVGKNMLKYNRLYLTLINQAIRINTYSKDPKVKRVLESVNNVKKIIKITPKTNVVVLNGDFIPNKELRAIGVYNSNEVIVAQGTMAKFIGVATEAEAKARKRGKQYKLVRHSSAKLVKIILLNNPDKGEIILPIAYLTPIKGASDFFQTTKLEYVTFKEMYSSLRANWEEIKVIRSSIKEDLERKSAVPALGMAF